MLIPIVCKPGSSLENKTGSWRTTQRPKIDVEKCIGCRQCVIVCPENCIIMTDDNKAQINLDYCKGCGLCAEICSTGAIQMETEEKKENKK